VINDANRNGIQDPGESGISRVQVECYSPKNTLAASASTDSQGYYKICNLPPDNYTVKLNLPAGYVLGTAYSATRVQASAGSNTLDIDGYAWLGTSTSLPTAGAAWPTAVVFLTGVLLLFWTFAIL
jgi:hypothetical protein